MEVQWHFLTCAWLNRALKLKTLPYFIQRDNFLTTMHSTCVCEDLKHWDTIFQASIYSPELGVSQITSILLQPCFGKIITTHLVRILLYSEPIKIIMPVTKSESEVIIMTFLLITCFQMQSPLEIRS